MKSSAIFSLIIAGSLVPAFNLREVRNYTRIINGQNAAPDKFTYHAGLSFDDGDYGYLWCGGALIAEEWVLTAAQCTLGAVSVRVILGSITQSRPDYEHRVYKRDILAHEGYIKSSGRADIALIKISRVKRTEAIRPIDLPRKFQRYRGTTVTALGWGPTSNSATVPAPLQYVTLKVIKNSHCEKFYGKDVIYGGKICTGDTGSAVCSGDFGSPLVSTSGRILIGIASVVPTVGCGKGNPDAFTRIDFYLDWIREKTRPQ